jgi:hypothetical protein
LQRKTFHPQGKKEQFTRLIEKFLGLFKTYHEATVEKKQRKMDFLPFHHFRILSFIVWSKIRRIFLALGEYFEKTLLRKMSTTLTAYLLS